MIKVRRSCKELYPNLLHVTCLNHALNLVCENIKTDNRLTNELISQMKASFPKSHCRKEMYEENVGNISPPSVVEVRWHTWMKAAFFYRENFSKVKLYIDSLSEDAACVTCNKYNV